MSVLPGDAADHRLSVHRLVRRMSPPGPEAGGPVRRGKDELLFSMPYLNAMIFEVGNKFEQNVNGAQVFGFHKNHGEIRK